MNGLNAKMVTFNRVRDDQGMGDTVVAQEGHQTGRQVWSVAALCLAMAQTLQTRFNPVVIEGEISGLTQASSGHWYFNLKDSCGQLRCAMFKRYTVGVRFNPCNGDFVRLLARVDVYGPRGDLQLVVETMENAGQGQLMARFLQLKTQLQEQGLFDAARKRRLPLAPRAIGLVTSLAAAALADVVSTLARRVPHIPIILVSSQVQGGQAPSELIGALNQLRRLTCVEPHAGSLALSPPVDVVLLVRGGGSIEDLWAFNDERLARAIADFPVPIVTGIGHETDFTIADFVADVRAPTPTAAAELVSETRAAWLGVVQAKEQQLQTACQRQIEANEQRLDAVAAQLGRPSDRIGHEMQRLSSVGYELQRRLDAGVAFSRQRLDKFAHLLPLFVRQQVQTKLRQVDQAQQALRHLDPHTVLERGFAWLTDANGAALTSAQSATQGQSVTAHLSDGTLTLQTLGIVLDKRGSP